MKTKIIIILVAVNIALSIFTLLNITYTVKLIKSYDTITILDTTMSRSAVYETLIRNQSVIFQIIEDNIPENTLNDLPNNKENN